QPELLHRADTAHDLSEDVADVGRPDVAEREARILECREARFPAHLRVRALGPHPEALHPDAENRDVLHHRRSSTGRKRTITTSRPSSSRIGSISVSSVMPTR